MTIYSQISENKVKTWLIMGIFVVIFSGFFYIVGQYYGSANEYLFLGLFISILSTIGSYFYSDKIILLTTGAKPANKKEFFDLYTVTENIAMTAGLPMPKVYVIEDTSPNTFATGRDPKNSLVCVTTGLLSQLDRTELEGVIAHELSHIKNYDILLQSIVAVLVGTIALIADWIIRSLWWGKRSRDSEDRGGRSPIFFLLLIVALIITPIISTLIQLAISRRREYLADASAALLTRYPDGLARALEKISSNKHHLRAATSATAHLFISNPIKKTNSGGWLVNIFSTHPPIEERIKILRSM